MTGAQEEAKKAPWLAWSSLRSLTRNSLFKGSAILLVVGSLVAAILEHLQVFDLNVSAPLTFKAAFLGSLIGGIAVGLFGWLCPEDIKRFDSFENYLSLNKPVDYGASPDAHAAAILTHVTELTAPVKNRLRELNQKNLNGTISAEERTELLATNALYLPTAVQYFRFGLWNQLDRSHPSRRITIALLLFGGALLTGVVFLYRAEQLLLS